MKNKSLLWQWAFFLFRTLVIREKCTQGKYWVLLLCCTLSTASSGAGLVLTCAYQDSDNYPYQIGDANSTAVIDWEKPGIAVEMVKQLESHLPLKTQFKRLPWKRAEQMLKEGRIDCLFNASYKKERLILGQYPLYKGHVDVNKRSYYNAYSFFTYKGSGLGWNGIALHNPSKKPIGVQMGFSIVADLQSRGMNIYQSSSLQQLMRMLAHKRIAGLATFEAVGDVYLKKFHGQFPNLIKVSPNFKRRAYYLMLSHQFVRKHPEIALSIWQKIALIRESDDFKKRMEKYLP